MKFFLSALIFLISILPTYSQSGESSHKTDVSSNGHGTKLTINIHGKSLENNLLNDSPDRAVSIYLPPNYDVETDRKYPVIYLLPGYLNKHDTWYGRRPLKFKMDVLLDSLISHEIIRPMIVVSPNAFNKYYGSFYTNSDVSGNWEDYIVKDLVEYMDSNYRTLAKADSRGVAGHSMGGYGAIMIGMKHPKIFKATYSLSGAFLVLDDEVLKNLKKQVIMATQLDSFPAKGWLVNAVVAAAVAFAPNKSKGPCDDPKNICGDFPINENGELIAQIWEDWKKHDPFSKIKKHRKKLNKLIAFQIDCGTKDNLFFESNVKFSKTLEEYGIEHTFKEYDGNHLNKIGKRIETEVLPFFSKSLVHK